MERVVDVSIETAIVVMPSIVCRSYCIWFLKMLEYATVDHYLAQSGLLSRIGSHVLRFGALLVGSNSWIDKTCYGTVIDEFVPSNRPQRTDTRNLKLET
jgi:hypothetical protein